LHGAKLNQAEGFILFFVLSNKILNLVYIFLIILKIAALRKIYLLYFFLLALHFAKAQSLRKPISASYVGLGAYCKYNNN